MNKRQAKKGEEKKFIEHMIKTSRKYSVNAQLEK